MKGKVVRLAVYRPEDAERAEAAFLNDLNRKSAARVEAMERCKALEAEKMCREEERQERRKNWLAVLWTVAALTVVGFAIAGKIARPAVPVIVGGLFVWLGWVVAKIAD